jgi:predicted porin
MKRTLIALAIAAPLAAHAAPTVYGQLNLSFNAVDNGTKVLTTVESNNSRLGVMGEEALGNKLTAIYKAEWAVGGNNANNDWNTTSDSPSDLTARDRYLGVKSNYGTVKFGAFDTPLQRSQGGVDQFNDLNMFDMASGQFVIGDDRMDQAISYESPKIADAVVVTVAKNGNRTGVDRSSTSAVYSKDGIYGALAYETNNDATDRVTNKKTNKLMRLTVGYTAKSFEVGALYQSYDDGADNSDKVNSLLLSGAYKLTAKDAIKAQIVQVSAGGDAKPMQLTVGYDHSFTSMTKAFAAVSTVNYDADGVDDDTIVAVGMQTKF